LPSAGLFTAAFSNVIPILSNYRMFFDWLDFAFRNIWFHSKNFRRIQGLSIQVKGR